MQVILSKNEIKEAIVRYAEQELGVQVVGQPYIYCKDKVLTDPYVAEVQLKSSVEKVEK